MPAALPAAAPARYGSQPAPAAAAVTTDLAVLLRSGLLALGDIDSHHADALLAYLALLQRWNQTYNLTAIRDPAEMVVKHLLDSLSLARHVDADRLVDIGSGAGLPAIPLAIVRPSLQVTMVETAGKKARFLREAVRQLGLAGRVQVHGGRAEQLDQPAAYDRLSARALGSLAEILRLGGHLLRPGGRLLAMKGREPSEEIAALPVGYRHLATVPLQVPGLDAERCLVVVEKA